MWNTIFPLFQGNETNSAGVQDAELVLAGDPDSLNSDVFVPYKYEPDHAVLLGLNGQHGVSFEILVLIGLETYIYRSFLPSTIVVVSDRAD